MEEYQKRVIGEKEELDKKIDSLRKFIIDKGFCNIDAEEQIRLRYQHRIMVLYSDILNDRIFIWE